ncbi:hypothetical protein L0Z72_01540 [candidate division KSB1 bacterium]|nr:hypothetical protein [candidate division KSB1 bacterium]
MKKIILVLLFCSVSWLHGAVEIIPLNDVKPGMQGKGYTVFEGDRIEQFDVEVINIVHNFMPKRDLVIVRLLGEKVNHTGVVAGMSGSPIYIGDKLMGALAYSLGIFMKEPIAGITPIEEMLEIFNREKVRDQELIAATSNTPSYIVDYLQSQHLEKFDLFAQLQQLKSSQLQDFKPIAIPFVFSGFHPSILEKFCSHFEQLNFIPLPGGKLEPNESEARQTIEPGSAIAGSIISGDFDISAVGTVTLRDQNKILAFGHPFFNNGPVNIPMAEAKVITTLSSLYASNKYAVATNIIGTIRQDRSTGIMGIIGEIPPTIPVHVKVNSPLSQEKTFKFMVANDRSSYNIVPVFLWMTLINALESARMGMGDYAIKLTGRIDLENATDVILDDFYSGAANPNSIGSGQDISAAAVDIVMTLSALLLNNFETAKINKIDLTFHAQPGRKLAIIEKIFYDKQIIAPGDSLVIIASVRPYQGKVFEVKKRIRIPQNLPEKNVIIAIGGRPEVAAWEAQAGIGRFTPGNFRELVDLLNRKRKNTDIIIQLRSADKGAILHGREYPSLPPSIFQILADKKTQKTYDSMNEKILDEWTIPVDFEIFGGRKFNLAVH